LRQEKATGPRTRFGLSGSNEKLLVAIARHLGKSITLAGKTWTLAELKQTLVEENELIAATSHAYVMWRDKVKTLRAKTKANNQVRNNLQAAVRVGYGEDVTVLAEFGYKARKPRRRSTPKENLIKAARAKATRTARGTLGSRQRKRVKGALSAHPDTSVVVSSRDPKR
jgi:hypothetical protein